MLVPGQARRQHDAGTHPPNDARQFDRVSGTGFEMGIAIQLNKLNRRAEEGGGFFRLRRSLLRRAVRRRFAARANDEMRFSS